MNRTDFNSTLQDHTTLEIMQKKARQHTPRSIRRALPRAQNGHGRKQKKAINKIIRWLMQP